VILDKYIQKYKKAGIRQDILNSLFKPEKKAAVLQLQEEAALLQGDLSGLAFKKLYEKFKWMSCLDIHNDPWSQKEFREHISGTLTTVQDKSESFDKYKDEFHINISDYKYLSIAKRFVYIKDARDDFRRRGVYLAGKFFQEIAMRLQLTYKELSLLQESEVIECLENNVSADKKIIAERKSGFILYLNGDKQLTCLSGKYIPKALKQFRLIIKEKKHNQLKGVVASKGNAKGVVLVVKGIKDLTKDCKGQILVAVSTHPDYVPAMRKAVAIITDEGGITSHAAIVAREFAIPCIVGTINATKILKDGNVVELDCDKGLIHILK
jgi:phosphohistidine swiveling domain-containing protein